MLSGPQATIIAGLLGLIGGFVAAEINRKQKADELFFEALKFLGGGTQVRNLGIAAIELYWEQKRHREVSVPLLVGAAIYLLTQSKQTVAEHEQYNLERIIDMLKSDHNPTQKRATAYARLHKILLQKPGQRGVQVPNDLRESWVKTFAALNAKSS
jgi:hypothetical protein